MSVFSGLFLGPGDRHCYYAEMFYLMIYDYEVMVVWVFVFEVLRFKDLSSFVLKVVAF